MLDTALGEGRRIQKSVKLVIGQVGHLPGDLLDGSPFRVGLLGDSRTQFIANDRVQCGYENGVASYGALDVLLVHRARP